MFREECEEREEPRERRDGDGRGASEMRVRGAREEPRARRAGEPRRRRLSGAAARCDPDTTRGRRLPRRLSSPTSIAPSSSTARTLSSPTTRAAPARERRARRPRARRGGRRAPRARGTFNVCVVEVTCHHVRRGRLHDCHVTCQRPNRGEHEVPSTGAWFVAAWSVETWSRYVVDRSGRETWSIYAVDRRGRSTRSIGVVAIRGRDT